MSKQTLRVTLVQAELAWHDAEANRRKFESLLAEQAGQTDLVVLPEMFTTGFTMEPRSVAEPAGGRSVEWMRALAANLKSVVTGSIATEQDGEYFNRLIWMRPDGSYAVYDKRHLFRLAGEDRQYVPGTRRLIVELDGWKICPMICYDLRFAVWSRNRIGSDAEYDLLLFVANWPDRRRHAWQTLLQARAIENSCYCIGVNRVGRDANGFEYKGDSAAIDFLGHTMTPAYEKEFVHTVALELAGLKTFRSKFPVHLDAEKFSIEGEMDT